MALPDVAPGPVQELGIDDFSFRRGWRFGTILVDLERHRAIDLLPDRQAETAAAWMRQRPTIGVVSRDRGGEYASAARTGAPQARQCADRFHLVKNLGEAVEDLLAQHLSASRKHQVEGALQAQAPAWREARQVRRPHPSEEVPSASQQDRLARYGQLIAWREQGMTQSAIARQLGVSLATVQRWLAAETFPTSTRGRYVSRLDSSLPSLFQRWEQGCHKMARL
jgi:hypothetical protein